jgi:hypothetical protein
MALVGSAGCGLVACASGVLVAVDVGGQVGPLVGWLLVVFGSLGFLTASLVLVVRGELRRQAGLVTTTAERWLIEILPPARVLRLLLDRLYGPSRFNEDLVTAVLGGEGLSADGADLTISEHTEIYYRLARIDEHNYHLVLQAQYSFRSRVPTNSVVIFATSDHNLRDSIVTACRLPLFELWFVREGEDTAPFAETVQEIKESVRVGAEFVDEGGVTHTLAVGDPVKHLHDVGIAHWGRYLTFFRGGQAGELARRSEYLDKLRIFEVDLKELADESIAVSTILGLTVRTTTRQQVVDGYCYWQAPYPCFVERMRFDTTTFDHHEDPGDMWFHLKPFTVRSSPGPPRWSTRDPAADLLVQSWFLPGHGVALMWRPGVAGTDSLSGGGDPTAVDAGR